MLTTIKRSLRNATTRLLQPHLLAQTEEFERLIDLRADVFAGEVVSRVSDLLASGADRQPIDPILSDFNHLLHELRTIQLREFPLDSGTLLSAGCAGAWYFDWVREAVPGIRRHIGVELYTPRPDGLDESVTWISASASSMPEVEEGSVDAVFSGQNLEHLWIDDLVGFLLESGRVLRPGGSLVLDSPNRKIVEALGWSHPEHTIELTAGEACELLTLAGFDVDRVEPVWRCRSRSGELLPLSAKRNDVRELLGRAHGPTALDDAFVWWIVSRRSARSPDTSALRDSVEDLFKQHWTPRVNRGASSSFGKLGLVPAGSSGELYRTQMFPVFKGQFEFLVPGGDGLRIQLMRPDETVIAEGLSPLRGSTATTEFGVRVVVSADSPTELPIHELRIHANLTPS